MVDVDDALPARAALEPAATAEDDAVDAAPASVAAHRPREELLDDPSAFGVGSDIAELDVMRRARR